MPGSTTFRHSQGELASWAAGRRWFDWAILVVTLALGLLEAVSPGLGWPVVRVAAALFFAAALLLRRRRPLAVLAAMAGANVAANVALSLADHAMLLSGLVLTVAVHSLARWGRREQLAVGTLVVVAHGVAILLVDQNSSLGSVVLLHGGPLAAGLVARPSSAARVGGAHQPFVRRALAGVRRVRALRVLGIVVLFVWLFVTTQGAFVADQTVSYVTRARSPAPDVEWLVDDAALRRAAEVSRGTHGPDGAVRHTVDYPFQLLAALESPTLSVEANVTVIDGRGFLQHDPRDPVGMTLSDLLEIASLAEFPIVKLDLKRDRVGPILDEVQQAIDDHGLDPRRLQFNADVFRGPGVENDVLGARTDMSFVDRIYNLVVMELETSDLARIASRFPESTIVISSTTPTGSLSHGYSLTHLRQFLRSAEVIRQVNPDQVLAFAVRGDLAVTAADGFLEGLTAVEDSHVAAWWSADVRPTDAEIEELRARGVTFFDLGELG